MTLADAIQAALYGTVPGLAALAWLHGVIVPRIDRVADSLEARAKAEKQLAAATEALTPAVRSLARVVAGTSGRCTGETED